MIIQSDTQNCVVYARYSSHAQKDTSIEDQVRDIEAYCRQNNLRIVKVYADRHLSGTNDKRPQFQQMLKDAAHGGWSYVVVWKTDRFARNRYDSAMYKYKLKRYGVRVISAKESIPDGPEGILLESILEGSAEYYSANLAQNIRRGLQSNALECKVNSGSIAYGYRKGEDGRYAIDETEAEIVRDIFRKVADGVPFVEISADLNRRGIRTKRGGEWNKNSFHRMLRNDLYTGVYIFSDTRIEGGCPSIIDKALFLEVARKLDAKKKPHGRHRENGDYMLTGKLFCGLCGYPMTGVSGTGKHGDVHYYYVCNNRRNKKTCTKENVSREWIENVVMNAALDTVLQPDIVEWIADQVMAYQEREGNTAQLLSLQEELKSTKKSADNVMKAIEAGIITASTKQRLLELESEVSRIQDAITLEEASITHIDREFIVWWLKEFKKGNRDDKEFRRRVIDTFIAAVYLWDDHIRIAFNYSGTTQNTVEREIVTEAEALAGAEGGSFKLSQCPLTERQTNPTAIYFVGSVFVLTMSLPKKRR